MKSSYLVFRGETVRDRCVSAKVSRAVVGVYHELASLQDPLKILGSENVAKFAVIGRIPLLCL